MQTGNLKYFSNKAYRYSFQGQEKDDEVVGASNSINYTYRMHDVRVGRFFAVDPLERKFPWNSPYCFSANNVIAFVDLEGSETFYAADGSYLGQVGSSTEIRVVNDVTNWIIYREVRDAYSNGDASINLADGREISVDNSLYDSAEKNLLANSSTVYTEMDPILAPWYTNNLPLSQSVEQGMVIFQATFTNFEGEQFIGFVQGTTVCGTPDEKTVDPTKSELFIGGEKVAEWFTGFVVGKTYGNLPYDSYWSIAAIVHTHPSRNKTEDEGFSAADVATECDNNVPVFMMAFSDQNRTLYGFSPSEYKEATKNSDQYQWRGTDDLKNPISKISKNAVQLATKRTTNYVSIPKNK